MKKNILNSEIYWVVSVWSILWIIGIGSHIKFSMDYDELQSELNAKDNMIENRIAVYEKLADPKRVQLYVSELNDILDNMTRLIKVIESGEGIDIFLGKIEGDIKSLTDMINPIYPMVEQNRTWIGTQESMLDNFIAKSDSISDSIVTSFQSRNLELIKKFDIIENDLRDIRNTLTEVRNSKIGSKIFNK